MIVAQSLPMAVPIFNQRNEDDYEEVSYLNARIFFNSNMFSCEMFSFLFGFQYQNRQDNVDIAASIKALAQSVHGEAIFGALPKPRFSTQI